MKLLLASVMALVAVTGIAAAWLAPSRQALVARPAVRLDEAGQCMTARPLSALSDVDRAQVEALRKRVDDLDAKLDKHQEEISSSWNELLTEVTRENARRTVEGERFAGVITAAGGKPVESQVEELMDETSRKRVKSMLRNWMDLEVGVLKSQLSLVGSQAAAVDQVVADIMKEEAEKVDGEEPSDNMIGWRGDIMQSARQKLEERLDPVLTGEQKLKAKDWFKEKDFGKGWREAQAKSAEGNK